MSTIQSGAAACVLDAMSNKETARALGVGLTRVEVVIAQLFAMYGARNRVELALMLQREVIES